MVGGGTGGGDYEKVTVIKDGNADACACVFSVENEPFIHLK